MRDGEPTENEHVEVRLRLTGRALGDAYRRFAEERLRRYGLAGAVDTAGSRATITARGPAELVDMLEVACLLGPAESLVESCAVERLARGTALA